MYEINLSRRKRGFEPRWDRHAIKGEKLAGLPWEESPRTEIRDILNRAYEPAGVPNIRIHGLRHTFGSRMAMAGGADPFAIMNAMGHTDIKTTMIYVSLGMSNIREQAEKLNSIHLLPSSTPRIFYRTLAQRV
jgi:integrase